MADPTTRPRTTWLVLAVLLASWLTACSDAAGDPDDDGGRRDAAAIKAEMDALAEDLLPDLVPVLGGELGDMEAEFVERGGFGLHDYRASAEVLRPAPRREALAEVVRVLEEHGLTVEGPGETSDLTINTLRTVAGDDDYVAEPGPTDYTDYLR